ncbi:MAG TPA: MotA/TolQ/ExbB proton channel family protein [Polyangiaceae bacterium]|nr:MotA/TolQ/ExbB proton channel family protein [Polyangiaceae bacterium]
MNIVERSKEILLDLGASPILFLMIGLSVLSLAVMLERLWFFTAGAVKLDRFARELEERLGAGDLPGARALTEGSRSVEVSILAAGLHHAERGVDAAREAMASATAIGRLRLERRLSFLGTLGNNAPFIGLLGTVIGIVQAFDQLQRAGLGGSASADIMGAIAEALVATAIGIAVAIPAVAAFNYFQRRIRNTLGNAEALEHILLSYLEGGGPVSPVASGRTPNPDGRRVRLSLSNISHSAGNGAALES